MNTNIPPVIQNPPLPITKKPQPTNAEPAKVKPLMIVGIIVFILGIVILVIGIVLNPERRHVDFVIKYDQLIDKFQRKQVGSFTLEEDEYVYGYESIVTTPIGNAPPDLYVFFGFHEDDTNQSRFNYTGGNYESSYSTKLPKRYNNGIIVLDGGISTNMTEEVLGSSPFFYDSKNLPLTYEALVKNQEAMYNGNERAVFLRGKEYRQFEIGQEYFAIIEFHPTTGTSIEMDVTIRVHIRKRIDFTFF